MSDSRAPYSGDIADIGLLDHAVSRVRIAGRTSTSTTQRYMWVVKLVVGLLGLAALVLLVRESGAALVWQTLRSALWLLPFLAVLEGVFAIVDVYAIRTLLGRAVSSKVPTRVWLESALLAYSVTIFLPAGRVGAEVARAHALGQHIGGGKATATAAHLQVTTLLANTAISVPCAIAAFVAVGGMNTLAWLIVGNGLVTLVLAGALMLVAKRSRIGAFLATKFAALRQHGAAFDASLRVTPPYARAIAWTTVGRVAQTLQCGLLVFAVGGHPGALQALLAEGVRLISGGLGDVVPNQVGVSEGLYRAFASDLGFASNTAKAVGIALLARLTQLACAGVALLTHSLLKAHAPIHFNNEPADAESASF